MSRDREDARAPRQQARKKAHWSFRRTENGGEQQMLEALERRLARLLALQTDRQQNVMRTPFGGEKKNWRNDTGYTRRKRPHATMRMQPPRLRSGQLAGMTTSTEQNRGSSSWDDDERRLVRLLLLTTPTS